MCKPLCFSIFPLKQQLDQMIRKFALLKYHFMLNLALPLSRWVCLICAFYNPPIENKKAQDCAWNQSGKKKMEEVLIIMLLSKQSITLPHTWKEKNNMEAVLKDSTLLMSTSVAALLVLRFWTCDLSVIRRTLEPLSTAPNFGRTITSHPLRVQLL